MLLYRDVELKLFESLPTPERCRTHTHTHTFTFVAESIATDTLLLLLLHNTFLLLQEEAELVPLLLINGNRVVHPLQLDLTRSERGVIDAVQQDPTSNWCMR